MQRGMLYCVVLVAAILHIASGTAQGPPPYDVIVVGAGLSGLNAAYRLVHTHRVPASKVLVLEARPRFGGRTYSPIVKKWDGSETRRDYGAEFTSPTAHRLMGYQDQFGLHRTPVYFEGEALFEDSRQKPYSANKRIPMPMPTFWAKFDYLKGLFHFSRLMSKVNLLKIWESEDAAEMDNLNLADFAAKSFRTLQAREFFTIVMEVMYGSPAKDISMLQLAHFVKSCHGLNGLKHSGEWHLRGGSQQVSENIVARGGFRIVLNSPVTKLEQDGTQVTVHTRHYPDKKLDVKGKHVNPPAQPDCANPAAVLPPAACPETSAPGTADETETEEGEQRVLVQTYRARYVIMAVPLPFAHNITYVPDMPEDRKALTKASYMATYTKVQIVCNKRTWQFFGGFATKGPFPIFADSSHPPEDNMDDAMIVGFFVPPSSLEVKKMSPEARKAAVFAQMRRQIKDDMIDARRCDYHEMEWDEDKWGKGVTVVLMPGTLSKYGQYLMKPAGRIFIGGSETSPEWNGYMEGALESGERTASEAAAAMACEKAHGPSVRLEHCSIWQKMLESTRAQEGKAQEDADMALRALRDGIKVEAITEEQREHPTEPKESLWERFKKAVRGDSSDSKVHPAPPHPRDFSASHDHSAQHNNALPAPNAKQQRSSSPPPSPSSSAGSRPASPPRASTSSSQTTGTSTGTSGARSRIDSGSVGGQNNAATSTVPQATGQGTVPVTF